MTNQTQTPTEKTEQMAIWIVKTPLSDKSEVFAVEINGEKVDCISENDAESLANGFAELIADHTNLEATVFYA